MRFRDRTDAGRQLANRLSGFEDRDVVVLALPRGGVPIGRELAMSLGAELDVIGVRKLGAPGQPELGIGAVAEDGVRVIDDRIVGMLGLGEKDLDALTARERAEVERRVDRYRGSRELVDVRGRTVVVTDDGLATGVTARAALRAVRAREPAHIVLAVPVGAADTVAAMADEADEIVVLHAPTQFRAVGLWYDDFEQTTDDEVVAALEAARQPGHQRRG